MAGLVLITDVTEMDLFWLEELAKLDYGGATAEDLIDCWRDLRCQLWRFDSGVVMTEVLVHALRKEFYVWGVAGKGLWKLRRAMPKAFVSYAKARGCDLIGANALDPRMGRFLEKSVGGKAWATKYLKEI